MALDAPRWFSWLSQGRWTKWHHRTAKSPNKTICGRWPVADRGTHPQDLTDQLHPDHACSHCLIVLRARNRNET